MYKSVTGGLIQNTHDPMVKKTPCELIECVIRVDDCIICYSYIYLPPSLSLSTFGKVKSYYGLEAA